LFYLLLLLLLLLLLFLNAVLFDISNFTRAVIPALFLDAFGPFVYHVIGVVETIKGILAFIACPLVGKVSDKVGRKVCLLTTVIGTCFPVCILAFTLDMRIYAVAQGD
jgi:MFS family permease